MALTCQDLDFDNLFYMMVVKKYKERNYHTLIAVTSILSTLSIVGTLSNILVLVVSCRSQYKLTYTYFIIALAMTDLTACSLVIPGLIVKINYHRFNSDELCKTWELLRSIVMPASSMLLISIAWDRYCSICAAFNGPRAIKKAWRTIIAIFIICIPLGIPPMLSVGVSIECLGRPIYIGYCKTNEFTMTMSDNNVYWYVVTGLFCLMFIFTAICYSMIYRVVYRQNKKWSKAKVNKLEIIAYFNEKPSDYKNEGQELSSHGLRHCPLSSQSISTCETKLLAPPEDNPSKVYFLTVPGTRPSDHQHQNSDQKVYPDEDSEVCDSVFDQRHQSIDVTTVSFDFSENIRASKRTESLADNCVSETMNTDLELSEITPVVENGNVTPLRKPGGNTRIPKKHKRNYGQNQMARAKAHINRITFKIKQRSAQIQMAKVMFVVSTVFIISFLPTFIVSYLHIDNAETVKLNIFYTYFINNVANPIVYSFMSKKFRDEMIETMRFIKKRIHAR